MPTLTLTAEEMTVLFWALTRVINEGDAAKAHGRTPESIPDYEKTKALLERIQGEHY